MIASLRRVDAMPRLPAWLRRDIRTDRDYGRVQRLVASGGLHTVCQSARCPNICECWNRGTATFMILGDSCTRNCRFCAVQHGAPAVIDSGEPERVATACREMGLRYAVITSVTRDDMEDGGAGLFAATIRAIRREVPDAAVEVLVPDFKGRESSISTVLEARPDVFAHNVETVARLQGRIRPQASYARSLAVLRFAAGWRPLVPVKSGFMVGMGETDAEIEAALADLRAAGCRMVTIGQYLAPTRGHAPVERFVEPALFEVYAGMARRLGFAYVASGPLVRSSYRAEELLATRGEGAGQG